MKKIALFLMILCFLLVGCGATKEQAVTKQKQEGFIVRNYTTALEPYDYYYKEHPKRIVAHSQNSIETLLELGAADRLIAVAGLGSIDHLRPQNREAYKKIPNISRHYFPQEELLAMKPDFILAWFFDFSGRGRSIGTTDFWLQRKVNIYMTLTNGADFKEKHTIEDELDYIRDVGKIVGKEERAQEIIDSINKKIAVCREQTAKLKKPKVAIIGNAKRVLTIYTPRTLPGNVATRLGGNVIGSNKERVGEQEYMSFEELVMENPDVVFLQSAPERDKLTLETFYNIHALQNLNCIKNKRVYCIPFYTIRCPGVRVDDAVEIMAKGLLDAVERR